MTGNWLKVNGEAIYSTNPWSVCQNETASSVFYTQKENHLYAIFLQWPTDNWLALNCVPATDALEIRFLGLEPPASASVGRIVWRSRSDVSVPRHRSATDRPPSDMGIAVLLPALTPDIIPCEHAWVIALTGWAVL
jgi:alpha-L-fucosidase